MPRREMTPAREAAYRRALKEALERGYAGRTAMDAVVAAVLAMEDSPLFNAGRGAVYNAEGRHELDAAVMDGATLRAGAVTCVSRVRNPVLAARAVMEHSPHVLLSGKGAETFAVSRKIKTVPSSYFHTPERLAALKAKLRHHHGTVGAVALDRDGNLAAATSTGGYTGKLPGRVGDSPLVGAGTYADNRACAVSGTGLGEAFIRALVAYDVAARMRYLRETLEVAARHALARVVALGGDGGLIAVDHTGKVAMPFVTEGMYRGVARGGHYTVAIYR